MHNRKYRRKKCRVYLKSETIKLATEADNNCSLANSRRLMAKFSEHLMVGSGFLNSARFPLPPNLNVDPSVIEGVSSCLHINIETGEGDVPRISGGQTSSPAALQSKSFKESIQLMAEISADRHNTEIGCT